MKNFETFRLAFEKFSVVRGGIQGKLDENPNAEPEEGAKPWYGKEDK